MNTAAARTRGTITIDATHTITHTHTDTHTKGASSLSSSVCLDPENYLGGELRGTLPSLRFLLISNGFTETLSKTVFVNSLYHYRASCQGPGEDVFHVSQSETGTHLAFSFCVHVLWVFTHPPLEVLSTHSSTESGLHRRRKRKRLAD